MGTPTLSPPPPPLSSSSSIFPCITVAFCSNPKFQIPLLQEKIPSERVTRNPQNRCASLMDGRGGCCIARCGGVGGAAYDTSKIGRIMLRFRPIAPKPVTSGAGSAGDKAPDGHSRSQKTGRGRRKNTTANNINKNSSSSGSDDNAGGGSKCKKRKLNAPVLDNTVVTLPLLPEAPVATKGHKTPVWLSFDGKINGKEGYCVYPSVREDMGMWPCKQREVVRSWVIVESVTDTWVEAEGMVLGRTDEEKKTILEEDTCPCLISDGWNRVWWTNKAYRKMARDGSRGGRREVLGEDAEVVVWVVMKEKVPGRCQAFTCRVRVQSAGGSTVTSPCDVWRMSGGGFAWRLDVKAALSLGR